VFICHVILLSDVDECVSNPCAFGGSCVDDVHGYSCNCVDGYFGSNCDISKYNN
jgi:Notch-like protein